MCFFAWVFTISNIELAVPNFADFKVVYASCLSWGGVTLRLLIFSYWNSSVVEPFLMISSGVRILNHCQLPYWWPKVLKNSRLECVVLFTLLPSTTSCLFGQKIQLSWWRPLWQVIFQVQLLSSLYFVIDHARSLQAILCCRLWHLNLLI